MSSSAAQHVAHAQAVLQPRSQCYCKFLVAPAIANCPLPVQGCTFPSKAFLSHRRAAWPAPWLADGRSRCSLAGWAAASLRCKHPLPLPLAPDVPGCAPPLQQLCCWPRRSCCSPSPLASSWGSAAALAASLLQAASAQQRGRRDSCRWCRLARCSPGMSCSTSCQLAGRPGAWCCSSTSVGGRPATTGPARQHARIALVSGLYLPTVKPGQQSGEDPKTGINLVYCSTATCAGMCHGTRL